jgi:RNA polymerase sigma-70 factor (ECF subfamily)
MGQFEGYEQIARRRATDAELLVMAARDPDAFGELYDRYSASAYQWARRAGLGEHDALELVAELFAQAWASRGRFRDLREGSAGAWLSGIARNLLASHRRRGGVGEKARRRLGMSAIPEADEAARADERLDAEARGPELEAAIDELPSRHREAVRLRVIDELGYSEVAERLRCTEPAARKRVSLGLRALRSRLQATTPARRTP